MNHPRTLISYSFGFLSSIGLTLVAYWLVVYHILTGWTAVTAILVLALVQCCVQLLFFLHLNDDTRPRWKLFAFLFMLVILCIVVVGSIWIMHNLNGRMMMSPEQMNKYMQSQAGL